MIPQPARAVLAALRLDHAGDPALPQSWDEALAFSDRTQLTLSLRARLAGTPAWVALPEAVRRRLDQNYADNTARLDRLRELQSRMAERFVAAGLEFLVLKGLSHSPAFVADPRERVQYDLDFFCPLESVYRARDLLLAMGYEPLGGMEGFPTDHLPTLIRKTGWRWRGNFFDPDHPPSIDLHFRFWDEETERLPAPGADQFWTRRAGCELSPADQLGYAALHALRHLLRGSLRPAHVYEIACFLQQRRADAAFWTGWREAHPPELRRLESVIFGLARLYFGAVVPQEPPAPARRWLERYGWSPVEALFRPNKHELLLHLALVDSARDRWRILRRRLAPLRLPGPVEAVHVPDHEMTTALRLRKGTRYARFVAGRIAHHARVLAPTLWELARWRGARQ